ncbi:MAG: sugar phosphate nucleotidyltransferase [Patescibacteria group bacterium]
MQVKKAVIAAAGFGTRFLPAVKVYPKELVPVLNKANIQYLIEELIAAGIEEITIVHRPDNTMLEEYFAPNKKLTAFLKQTGKEHFLDSLNEIRKKAKLYFIPQPKNLPYGNASPVLAAKKFIGKDPFVFLYGDDMLIENKIGSTTSELIKVFGQYHTDVVAAGIELPKKDFCRCGMVKFKKGSIPHQIASVVEKPAIEVSPSNIGIIGRFVVSPRAINVLETQKIARGELWFTDTVVGLSKIGIGIAWPIKSQWLTTGDPSRWLQVNLALALKDKTIAPEIKKFLKGKI